MSVKQEKLDLGYLDPAYVWLHNEDGELVGNLAIVVIDDDNYAASMHEDELLSTQLTILPHLREAVCGLSATRAIGFFPPWGR